jgi:hypothetical protein
MSAGSLPILLLPGGRVMARPFIPELADELGIIELPDPGGDLRCCRCRRRSRRPRGCGLCILGESLYDWHRGDRAWRTSRSLRGLATSPSGDDDAADGDIHSGADLTRVRTLESGA